MIYDQIHGFSRCGNELHGVCHENNENEINRVDHPHQMMTTAVPTWPIAWPLRSIRLAEIKRR
jgi:hypothetical protein